MRELAVWVWEASFFLRAPVDALCFAVFAVECSGCCDFHRKGLVLTDYADPASISGSLFLFVRWLFETECWLGSFFGCAFSICIFCPCVVWLSNLSNHFCFAVLSGDLYVSIFGDARYYTDSSVYILGPYHHS